MAWRKSSFCGTDHVTEQCIEVCDIAGVAIMLRSSKHPETVIVGDHEEFAAFLAGAKAGEFDDLV